MALPIIPQRTPTTIAAVTVILNSQLVLNEATGEYDTENKKASFSLHILDQDGTPLPPAAGDLLPHLTPDQITWLAQFTDAMRALAEAALPTT